MERLSLFRRTVSGYAVSGMGGASERNVCGVREGRVEGEGLVSRYWGGVLGQGENSVQELCLGRVDKGRGAVWISGRSSENTIIIDHVDGNGINLRIIIDVGIILVRNLLDGVMILA